MKYPRPALRFALLVIFILLTASFSASADTTFIFQGTSLREYQGHRGYIPECDCIGEIYDGPGAGVITGQMVFEGSPVNGRVQGIGQNGLKFLSLSSGKGTINSTDRTFSAATIDIVISDGNITSWHINIQRLDPDTGTFVPGDGGLFFQICDWCNPANGLEIVGLSVEGSYFGSNAHGQWIKAAPDLDSDGIPDDGDGSGTIGDQPCTGGDMVDCDDNCPDVENPGQEDTDGDRVGDVCDTTSDSLQIRAGFGSNPSDPATQSKNIGTAANVSATFPLGSLFFLQLAKSDLTGILSKFTTKMSTISPPLTGPALFSNHAIIEFDPDTISDTKYFRAVHLGKTSVTITPSNSSLPTVTVSVTINSPTSLGTTSNQFDSSLIALGHQRGIPPHFLKGQVVQESGFDPEAYRYEPLSADMKYISTGQNLRVQPPYSLYRLATSDGLAQGSGILSTDTSPRSIYKILVRGVTRPITDSDIFVSAKNIYDTNDDTENWSGNSPERAALVTRNPALLDFTAQTPLAGSYGLLQIMYSTALAPMGWVGVGGARNPSYLFDTSANIADGGGSLSVAAGYLRRVFARANPTISAASPIFIVPSEFVTAFRRAFNMYNHSSIAGRYGTEVINNAAAFPPAQATSIFPED